MKNEGIVDDLWMMCGRLYDNEGIVLVHVPATRKIIGSNMVLTYDFLTACLLEFLLKEDSIYSVQEKDAKTQVFSNDLLEGSWLQMSSYQLQKTTIGLIMV